MALVPITHVYDTLSVINNTGLLDGQILYTTDQTVNKIFADVKVNNILRRIEIGGTNEIDTVLNQESGHAIANSAVAKLAQTVHTNLLNPTLGTTTINGVTCTANGDGTYTLNGTATVDHTRFYFTSNYLSLDEVGLKKGNTYKLLDGLTDTEYAKYNIHLELAKDNIFAGTAYGTTNGLNIFTLPLSDNYNQIRYYINVRNGQTLKNVTFKPMLTTDLSATYDDFVQYSGNGELNQNVADLYSNVTALDTKVGAQSLLPTPSQSVTQNINTLKAEITQINSDLSNKLGKTETAENATKWSGITYDVGTNNTTDTLVPVLNVNKMQHRVIPTTYNTTNPTLDGLTVNADAWFNNGQVTVNRTDNWYYWHFLATRGDKRLFHTQYNDFNGGYNLNNRYGYELVSESGDMIFSANETGLFHFNGSGRYTGSWAQSSSRRYKKNIEPITDKDALKILDLNPVEFDFNDSGIHSHGLIAEEVSEIMPNLVIYNKEEQPDAIDYSQFVPYLLKLCQMQQLQIDELKEKIDELIEKSNKQ